MPLLRSANFNLFIEVLIRVLLLSAFCYMETMTPYMRVIHQSDMDTMYKYPRHDSFVPSGTLWAIVVCVPCSLSLIAWAVCNDCNDALEILLAWSLALGMNGILTDTMKLITGRPRPDFFYRCFPDGMESPKQECTGDLVDVIEGRKSFPSGHSSLSWCSLGCSSLWVCGRLRVLGAGRGRALAAVCSLAPLMAATGIALSRFCDYHHHWEDILVGSLLGFTTAVFCYRQHYNPLSSDLSGVPYIVSEHLRHYTGKPDSPFKDGREESTPLLNNKKEDKWI